jgi:predicted transcriptional regulator of viral defense system
MKRRLLFTITDDNNHMGILGAAALSLATRKGAIRWRDFAAAGVTPATIARLVDRGELERLGRGLYRRANHERSEHQSLIEAAAAAPNAVVCLLSALRFHGLTTELPHAVWLLIGGRDRAPKAHGRRLRIVRATGPALTKGVKKTTIDGVAVAVTTPAKTVADCFKYRNRVGLDVAIEALREGLKTRAFTADEFLGIAAADRVARVVRPYLEALQ